MLQRLVEFANRIPADKQAPPMYDPLKFKWQIELSEDGEFRGITPLSDGTKKKMGLTLLSPNRKRAGITPPSLLLADKANYVLGIGAESPSESWHFNQFLNLVSRCADETGESTVNAVLKFLNTHADTPIALSGDVLPSDLTCFRVGVIRPTDLSSVQRFWVGENPSGDGNPMQCLVCGRVGPVDRVSPVAIKGLTRIGGQSSGMALVSANNDAFLSYGAKQSLIAPTCRRCGEAYAKSINYMLDVERYRVFIGPTAFLFWTAEESEFNLISFLSQPQEEDVRELIESYRRGTPVSLPDVEAFYALTLSASASRVVVRDWLDTTLPIVQADLRRWFILQKIVDTDGSSGKPYGVYALAASLYLKPNDQMVANVPISLVRCAVHGGSLPDWILAQAIGRNRAENGVTRSRAGLIKAVLLSQLNDYKEDYMEKLDTQITSPGYLCGRLLAELEAAQYQAVRPKATLVDRYYGAASSSPAIVFGNLMRGLQAHMAKLRKDRPGVFYAIDTRIQDIMADLGEFPKTLNLKEQALFSLGYYHQKAANRASAIEHKNNNKIEEAE